MTHLQLLINMLTELGFTPENILDDDEKWADGKHYDIHNKDDFTIVYISQTYDKDENRVGYGDIAFNFDKEGNFTACGGYD